MTFNFHIADVQDHQQESFKRINATLADLCAMRMSEVGAWEGKEIVPKVVWKIRCYVQGIIYRTVELTEATASEWNNGNQLASIILARSVLETAAVVYDFSRRLQEACESADFSTIDGLVMSHTFSGQTFEQDEYLIVLPKICSLIDRMDQHLFRDKKKKSTRILYDNLSEISHPNYAGASGFYGELDKEHFLKRFSTKHSCMKRIASHIIAGTGCIEPVKMFIDDINKCEPTVWRISEEHAGGGGGANKE